MHHVLVKSVNIMIGSKRCLLIMGATNENNKKQTGDELIDCHLLLVGASSQPATVNLTGQDYRAHFTVSYTIINVSCGFFLPNNFFIKMFLR